jgi:signal transduction histidine kinase
MWSKQHWIMELNWILHFSYWKISFEDNGIGFEQQYENKILELFQRLHGRTEYSGTGIGLAICKKIVQNHNGVIKAIGTPGVGAIFSIYFPVANR